MRRDRKDRNWLERLLDRLGIAGLEARAEWRLWQRALRSPWRSAVSRHHDCRGESFELVAEDGARGRGEAAHPSTGMQHEKNLGAWVEEAGRRPLSWWCRQLQELTPSTRMALECALLDLAASRAGLPLYRLLNPNASGAIEVNAAAGELDEDVEARLHALAGEGYGIAKIKLGLAPVRKEAARLRGLAVPEGMMLRLDANRAWSDEAFGILVETLAGLPVEGLEEPLANPDPQRLREWQARLPFPLALDESLLDRYRGVPPEALPVARVVLKPSRMGGLLPALDYARAASAADRSVVFTSALEGPVGLAAILHLAAAWNTGVHGLATASWLESPPASLLPKQGRIRLTERPGAGL
ncbi:MAG TPA: o-succinylbenzoate synthase [Thiotrichales bacterium]|nr:o-succinylbenzoate synthase [Thiotrichales bacterium]